MSLKCTFNYGEMTNSMFIYIYIYTIKNESEIKTFPDKQKIRETVTTRPSL